MALVQLCISYSLVFLGVSVRMCASTASRRADLYDAIRNLSKPELIPVENDDQAVMVRASLLLASVSTLNQIEQYISVDLFLRMGWRNELTTWDPAQFGYLTFLYVPVMGFWTPDIMPLYTHGLAPNVQHGSGKFMQIQHTGDTIWLQGGHVSSYCPIDATNFPFDVQTCTLKFGSATFDSRMLNISLDEDVTGVLNSTTFYMPNSEWKIKGTSSKISTETKLGHLIYPSILYTINLERRSLIIVTTKVFPVIVLSILNICVFKIPPETTDKARANLTILLSFSVVYSYISATFPPNGERIPYLIIYISCLYIMSATTVLLTALTTSLSKRTDEVPKCFVALKEWMKKKLKTDIAYGACDDRDGGKQSPHVTWRCISITVDTLFFWIFAIAFVAGTLLYFCVASQGQ